MKVVKQRVRCFSGNALMCGIMLFSASLAIACNGGEFKSAERKVEPQSADYVSIDLSFSCSRELFPRVVSSVESLFIYARWLQKYNQLKRDAAVYGEVERLYRIATQYGHAKANVNLQNGAFRGYFRLRGHEHLRLSQNLIDDEVASGYYFVATFLQKGAAGLEQDTEMALRYYRKAADAGSPLAQYYVGGMLESRTMAPQVALQMYRCAAEQGHGEAAAVLGVIFRRKREYEEAIKLLQIGVLAGDENAAYSLWQAFQGANSDDELSYLGQADDSERAERYEKIWRILANYSYANPKVPEIDEIVPLPPAKLPSWDGKLQWLEERLANIPPPKPEEWLIEKLAKEKGLDPATGRPKPGSPAFKAEYFPADTCKSGEPCPQEGYWKVMWPESWVQNEEVIQHFNEGDLLPHPEGNYYLHRIWPLPRKLVKGPIYVKWGLLG